MRHPRRVITAVTVLAAWVAACSLRVITIDMDTNALFDPATPFVQATHRFDRLFPDRADQAVVVIDAPTLLDADRAAQRLATVLRRAPDRIPYVDVPGSGPFFERNALLYLDGPQLETLARRLVDAQPAMARLLADPSLRGLLDLLTDTYAALSGNAIGQAAATPLVDTADKVLRYLQEQRAGAFDWLRAFAGNGIVNGPPRAFVIVRPQLQADAIAPGAAACAFIRKAARQVGLTAARGYRVRLTGPVPLDDEEFATVRSGAGIAGVVSTTLVVVLLFLALRRPALVGASLFTLVAGLLLTLGWAALSVRQLNPISIAFAVLFVGLAVDFALQFCIRLRGESHHASSSEDALVRTAAALARPLVLAAATTASGLFAFLPTAYRGIAELGTIAGGGIVIALLLTLTLLPALLHASDLRAGHALLPLPGTRRLDAWLLRHRCGVLLVAALLSAVAAWGVIRLQFDFDPLHLKDPDTESMRTLADLADDPWSTPYTLSALAPSAEAARALEERLATLPEVRDVVSLLDYLPDDQARKLQIIDDLRFSLALDALPSAQRPAPSAADLRAAARRALDAIGHCMAPGCAAPAGTDSLRSRLERIANSANDGGLVHAATRLFDGLPASLARLFSGLDAEPVSRQDLPPALVHDWVAGDGEFRVEIYPRGNGDLNSLAYFVAAVRRIAPGVSGAPLSVFESGRLIIRAFTTAAVVAIAAITLLLALALRRAGDVARVLLPLVAAGLWTLGLCGLLGIPINFANIIGLPLLLGIGVTFPLYLVHGWRQGERDLLASGTARAVVFSALTTLASFAALALSPHPGTASLGLLLALALGMTLLATALLLPALLGQPRPCRNMAVESGS